MEKEKPIKLKELDELDKKLKKLLMEKEEAFMQKQESELNYIRMSHAVRLLNIRISKILRETRPVRRKYPHIDKAWRDKIVNEVGQCEYVEKGTRCPEKDKNKLTAHHIVPLGEGGSHLKTNLKVLCYKHHRKYHPITAEQYRREV